MFLPASWGTGARRSLTERRSCLWRTIAVAGRTARLSGDYHIAFLKITGDDFRKTPIGDSGANDARLQSLVGRQYPDDLNLPLPSAAALGSGGRSLIRTWLLSLSLGWLSLLRISLVSALCLLLMALLPALARRTRSCSLTVAWRLMAWLAATARRSGRCGLSIVA